MMGDTPILKATPAEQGRTRAEIVVQVVVPPIVVGLIVFVFTAYWGVSPKSIGWLVGAFWVAPVVPAVYRYAARRMIAKDRPGSTLMMGYGTAALAETLAAQGRDNLGRPRSLVVLVFGPNNFEVVSAKRRASLGDFGWTEMASVSVGKSRRFSRRVSTVQIALSGGAELAISPAPVVWYNIFDDTKKVAARTVRSLERLRTAADQGS